VRSKAHPDDAPVRRRTLPGRAVLLGGGNGRPTSWARCCAKFGSSRQNLFGPKPGGACRMSAERRDGSTAADGAGCWAEPERRGRRGGTEGGVDGKGHLILILTGFSLVHLQFGFRCSKFTIPNWENWGLPYLNLGCRVLLKQPFKTFSTKPAFSERSEGEILVKKA